MFVEWRADEQIQEKLRNKINKSTQIASELAKLDAHDGAATACLMHVEFKHIQAVLDISFTEIVEQWLAKLVLHCEKETCPKKTRTSHTQVWAELRRHTTDCLILATARALRPPDMFSRRISFNHHIRLIKAFGFNPKPEFLRLWSNLGGSKRKVFEPTIKKIKMNTDLAPPGFESNCKMDDMEFNEHGKECEPGELGEVDKAESKLVETTSEFCKAEGKGELDVACGEMIQTMSKRRGTRRPKQTIQPSMENDLANADGKKLEAKCDAGKACGEMLETQSEMDVAGGEVLETKAKFVRKRGRGRGREKRQRLRESTTDMHEAIDEAEEIEKKVEKVMNNA